MSFVFCFEIKDINNSKTQKLIAFFHHKFITLFQTRNKTTPKHINKHTIATDFKYRNFINQVDFTTRCLGLQPKNQEALF